MWRMRERPDAHRNGSRQSLRNEQLCRHSVPDGLLAVQREGRSPDCVVAAAGQVMNERKQGRRESLCHLICVNPQFSMGNCHARFDILARRFVHRSACYGAGPCPRLHAQQRDVRRAIYANRTRPLDLQQLLDQPEHQSVHGRGWHGESVCAVQPIFSPKAGDGPVLLRLFSLSRRSA